MNKYMSTAYVWYLLWQYSPGIDSQRLPAGRPVISVCIYRSISLALPRINTRVSLSPSHLTHHQSELNRARKRSLTFPSSTNELSMTDRRHNAVNRFASLLLACEYKIMSCKALNESNCKHGFCSNLSLYSLRFSTCAQQASKQPGWWCQCVILGNRVLGALVPTRTIIKPYCM